MRSRAGRLTETRRRMGLAGRWPVAAAIGVLVSVLVVGALLLARSPADPEEPAAPAQVAAETETTEAEPETATPERAPDPAAPGPEPEVATAERAPDPATTGPEPEAATSEGAPEPAAPDPEPEVASVDAEQAAPAPAAAAEAPSEPDPAEEPAAADDEPTPSEEPATAGESIPVRGGVTLSAGPEYTEAAARAAVAAAALARSAEVASPVVAVLPAPRLAPSRPAVSPPRLAEPSPPASESPPPNDEPSPASLAAQALPTAPPAAPPPAAEAAAESPPAPPLAEAPPPPATGQPLGNLAPDVVDLLLEPPGEISVAMIDLRRKLVFTHRGDVYFDLASVSKVPLMLTVLRERERDERALTHRERRLLEVMIQSSNNEAASTLWDEVSGEVPSLLFDSEIWPDILLPRGWGLWTGTAEGVARVFQEIVAGESLSPDVRDDAMGLLAGVVHWQRWGISAGLPDDGASVALKNGWYPQEAGWIVHSAGYVLDAGGRPDYVLVILSRHNPTLESGIALVEEIAAGLHAALRPTVVSAGLQQSAR